MPKTKNFHVGKSLKINQLTFSLDTFWTDMEGRKLSLQSWTLKTEEEAVESGFELLMVSSERIAFKRVIKAVFAW
jgi:hypothetical protein